MSDSKKRTNPLAGNALFPGDIPPIPALPEQEKPTPPDSSPTKRPTPPSVRVRRDKPYAERYTKETVSIDNRLLPFYYQLLETYPNNTVAVNDLILKACKTAGIEIPEEVEASLNPFRR